jgi:hypothetical protein
LDTKIIQFYCPQTIKVLTYIVVATSAKTDIQVDIDQIATDLNQKQDINTCVLKTGDTMSGALRVNNTLQTTGGFDLISNEVTKGTNPSSTAYWGIRFNDGSNRATWQETRLGVMMCSLDTSGTTQFLIGAYKNEANATFASSIVLQCTSNGTTYFRFPKCTTKATTTSSAADNKVAVVVQNYVNGASWYRVWSDGWIEQGGWVDSGVTSINSGVVVTFLKPYRDTNYTIVMGSSHSDTSNNTIAVNYGNAYYGCYYNGSKSTTSIRLTMKGTWYACGY